MEDQTKSEVVRDGLRTLEHQNLPKLIEMLLHIEGLRDRGWGFDEIADEMTAGPFEPPVGGAWSGSMVAEIVGVIDNVREEEDGQPPARGTTPLGDRVQEVRVRPPVRAANYAAGPLPAEDEQRILRSRTEPVTASLATEPYGPRPLPGSLPELDSPPHSGLPKWPFAALCLLLLAACAGYLFADRGSGGATNADANEIASEAVQTEGEEPLSADTATPQDPVRSTDGQQVEDSQTATDQERGEENEEEGAPDPADMMSIRVEPDAPAVIDPVTGQPIQVATATVRADGLLHLDGSFPTQDDADRYVAGMADVFGQDNIVENYQINPAAPLPASSDVALDKPVLFSSGTAEIDPSFYPFLEACGDVMKLNPHITMSIAAFTDSTGSEELNLELSQQRANAIYEFYLAYDLGQEQLQPLAFGEAEPVADNATEAGRQANRRAMLRLLGVLAEESEGS